MVYLARSHISLVADMRGLVLHFCVSDLLRQY